MKEEMLITKKLFECIADSSKKPSLFQPGEPLFWDDPHISKSMLKAHLNPDFDGASRAFSTIESTVEHFMNRSVIKPEAKVLDLGCGPGLYSIRMAKRGINVTGIDISKRSIEYAEKSAEEAGLNITYICGNFFNINYTAMFDNVFQIYGELSTFSNERRNQLLRIIHKALKKDGLFVFDISTRVLRMREGMKNRWYFVENGFWRPTRHLVLEQGFDYPENDSWLNQYTVIDESGDVKIYRIWFHDYSLETISEVLHDNGFKIECVWDDLTGKKYTGSGDWIAIAAKKI